MAIAKRHLQRISSLTDTPDGDELLQCYLNKESANAARAAGKLYQEKCGYTFFEEYCHEITVYVFYSPTGNLTAAWNELVGRVQ